MAQLQRSHESFVSDSGILPQLCSEQAFISWVRKLAIQASWDGVVSAFKPRDPRNKPWWSLSIVMPVMDAEGYTFVVFLVIMWCSNQVSYVMWEKVARTQTDNLDYQWTTTLVDIVVVELVTLAAWGLPSLTRTSISLKFLIEVECKLSQVHTQGARIAH